MTQNPAIIFLWNLVSYISCLRNSIRTLSACFKAAGFQGVTSISPLGVGVSVPSWLQSSWCSPRQTRAGLSKPRQQDWEPAPSPHSLLPTFSCFCWGRKAAAFHVQLCQALAELCSSRGSPGCPQLGSAAQWQQCGCAPPPFDSAQAVNSLVFYSV